MNTTKIIYTVLWWAIVVLLSYIVITQPKVKAGNEILEIQQRLLELDELEQWEKDKRHIDEESKAECIMSCTTSYGKLQDEESKKAQEYREEKEMLKERLGFLMSRPAQ